PPAGPRHRGAGEAIAEELAEQLATAVGDRNVVRGEALEDYRHDGTFMDGSPLLAVRPGSTEEVAAVVRICAGAGVPVTARGAGSGLVGGPVPLGGGVVLSLERLDSVEIDTANICARVG